MSRGSSQLSGRLDLRFGRIIEDLTEPQAVRRLISYHDDNDEFYLCLLFLHFSLHRHRHLQPLHTMQTNYMCRSTSQHKKS